MAAGHEQREEREFRRALLEHRRQQVAFHVVYRDHGTVPGEAEAIGQPAADHQGADEARPRRVGDGVRLLDAGLAEHLLYQRQQPPDVVAGGDFGHDPAIDRVQVHLAVQRVRDQPGFGAVDRDAGLVAARFDAQNVHIPGIITAVLRVGNGCIVPL